VKGLAAALLGGLASLPGAFVGGLVVGLLEVHVTSATLTWDLPGVPTLAVFGLILAVLLFRPGGLFGRAPAVVA
jgi:branched-chain amino acid transport system permease protein